MSKKTKIWLNVLLDESGSMGGIASKTITEFNDFIKEQETVEEAQILATLTTFADSPRHLYIARPIDQVPKLSDKNYSPGGCTALFDAIGASMKTVEDSMRREDEKTGVLFVIITDGMENASHELKMEQIREMIKDRKEKGWNFLFLGEDIDNWQGRSMGINSSVRVSKGKTDKMYAAVARSTSLYAAAIDRGEQVDDICSLNAADYEDLD
jgi:uncharacterized protein YegL